MDKDVASVVSSRCLLHINAFHPCNCFLKTHLDHPPFPFVCVFLGSSEGVSVYLGPTDECTCVIHRSLLAPQQIVHLSESVNVNYFQIDCLTCLSLRRTSATLTSCQVSVAIFEAIIIFALLLIISTTPVSY